MKVALVVDDIIGQQQVVIKSLEENFERIEGIAGGTILGDGNVALIVDVQGLKPTHRSQERRLGRGGRRSRADGSSSSYGTTTCTGSSASAQNALQLIAFSIGEQTYGVEITTVREIRAWNGATPLPNTREFVRGVINLRGTIVPIFDLRARFGEGQTSPTKNHVVVVMSVGEKWVGMLVDAVSDILTVAKDDIHAVPEGNSIDTELLNGIVTHDSRMVGLIDLHAVVSRRQDRQPDGHVEEGAGRADSGRSTRLEQRLAMRRRRRKARARAVRRERGWPRFHRRPNSGAVGGSSANWRTASAMFWQRCSMRS